MDLKEFFKPGYIFEHVLPAVLSKNEENDLKTKSIYYEDFLDLLVVYYIPVGEVKENAEGYIHLTEPFIHDMKIDKEKLKNSAVKNITNNAVIKSIDEILGNAFDVEVSEDKPKMLVVSTETNHYGSGCFLSPFIMNTAAEILESDSVGVIPSSKEELILIDFDEDLREEYNGIINKVNETVGDKYLSNHIYTYSTDTQTVCC